MKDLKNDLNIFYLFKISCLLICLRTLGLRHKSDRSIYHQSKRKAPNKGEAADNNKQEQKHVTTSSLGRMLNSPDSGIEDADVQEWRKSVQGDLADTTIYHSKWACVDEERCVQVDSSASYHFPGSCRSSRAAPPPPAPYLWLSHRWLSSPEQILNVLVISGFFIIMSIALQICILHFSWTRQPFVPNVISRGWRRCTLTAPCAVWFISCSFLHGRRREGGQWGARYFKHKHYTRPINVHWY